MDATLAIHRIGPWPNLASPLARQLARSALATLFALAASAGLFVCVRRLSGALSEPLPGALLFAIAVSLAAGAIAFRRAAFRLVEGRAPAWRYALWTAPSVVLALWAVGLWVPGTTGAALAGFVGLLAIEEGFSWGRLRAAPGTVPIFWSRTARGMVGEKNGTVPLSEIGCETSLNDTPLAVLPKAARGGLLDELSDVDESAAPTDPPNLEDASQWIVRRRDEGGAEVMEGWVRLEFAPGQRHALAHLAICPPFAMLPTCYAEVSNGPDAQVKVGQVLAHGVRLDIKLDEPAEEATMLVVEFSIQEHGGER